VVDSSKAARSVAAIVLGFLRFDQRLRIAGVILNNVASDRHAEYLREAMSSKAGNNIRILGMIRRDPKAKMEERHLGLVPALELEKKRQKRITSNAREIAEQLDIDGIVDVIRMQPASSDDNPKTAEPRKRAIAKIAVALDESFNFYYQDNIEALREAGAVLEFFSPVNDKGLPEGIDGLVLGGGFPEVLADKLEKNGRMIKSIRRQVNEDMPAYGECGGLMYLSRSISGFGGSERRRRMLGVVDADTAMTGKLTLNYTEAECRAHLFGRCLLRGHEFHYSELRDIAMDCKFAYSLRRGKGIVDGRDGIVFSENGIAAYSHHHFSGNWLAAKLVDACAKYSRR
jgi:cobyrinic acid a,c-diamide synthase